MGVSRTYAQTSTLYLRVVEVCMASVFPTKELLQMIEERIPYVGRFLTTAALLLALLAIIVGACSYLYSVVIFPIIRLVIIGVTTGKINPSALGRVIASLIGTVAAYFLLEWLHRGSSRIMQEVLDSSKDVLEHN